MRRGGAGQARQGVTGVVAGVLVAAAAVALTRGGDSTDGVDRISYEEGYEAFGGAETAFFEKSQGELIAECHMLWRQYGLIYGAQDHERIETDWIAGCTDFTQHEESTFE